jgi:hypothetical protein
MEDLTSDTLRSAIDQMSQRNSEDYQSYTYHNFTVEVWSLEGKKSFEINIQAPLFIQDLDRDTNQLGEVEESEELLDIVCDTLYEMDIIGSRTTQGLYLIDTIENLTEEEYNYYTTHSLTYSG